MAGRRALPGEEELPVARSGRLAVIAAAAVIIVALLPAHASGRRPRGGLLLPASEAARKLAKRARRLAEERRRRLRGGARRGRVQRLLRRGPAAELLQDLHVAQEDLVLEARALEVVVACFGKPQRLERVARLACELDAVREGHDVVGHAVDAKDGGLDFFYLVEVGEHVEAGRVRHGREDDAHARGDGGDEDEAAEVAAERGGEVDARAGAQRTAEEQDAVRRDAELGHEVVVGGADVGVGVGLGRLARGEPIAGVVVAEDGGAQEGG